MEDLPNLRLLKIFESIVKHRGFRGAQEELNLSASAISNHLSALESAVGFKLCHRGRAGFRLTAKGEQYFQNAIHILEEIEQFNRANAELNETTIGTLNIGILDGLVDNQQFHLSEAIYLFHQQFPHVNITLQTRMPHSIQDEILNSDLSLGIGSFPNLYAGIWSQPLFKEQQHLYCGSKHELYSKKLITKEMIAKHKIVGKLYWHNRTLLEKGLNKGSAYADSMETLLLMILSGAFIGYLPEDYANDFVSRGKLKKLESNEFSYQADFSLICRRDSLRDPLIQKFRSIINQQLNESQLQNP